MKRDITTIIIHCAATPNGKSFSVKDINDWHKLRPGFRRKNKFVKGGLYKHIGYHFVIGIDGEVMQGRDIDEVGAHAKGHNSKSIGICMIGTDKFSNAQWVSLINGVNALINRFPNAKVIGHNDISNKGCPCFDAKKWHETGIIPQENIYQN